MDEYFCFQNRQHLKSVTYVVPAGGNSNYLQIATDFQEGAGETVPCRYFVLNKSHLLNPPPFNFFSPQIGLCYH
jgi:hypothetical protein